MSSLHSPLPRVVLLLALASLTMLPRAQTTEFSCLPASGAQLTQLRIGDGIALLVSNELERRDAQARSVRGLGDLQAVFVDNDGWLREDGDGDAQLGDYTQDPALAFVNDDSTQGTRLRRYLGNPALGLYNSLPYSALRPLWSAAMQLAEIGDARLQRDYRDSSKARHLLTALDLNLDNRIDNSELRPFTTASFGDGVYGVLRQGSASDAAKLIDYARGVAIDGLRARELNTGDGLRTQRLAMLPHAVPLLVGAPAEAYDLQQGDATYAAFIKRYRQRRQVVYIGAADGLLHAFNAGFRSNAGIAGIAYQRASPTTDGSSAALGAELWAYAPFNLLPHLPELLADAVPQNAVVDGTPRAFDARVFGDDSDHPGGWGTLLVVGMRLGGSAQELPRSAQPSAFTSFANSSDRIRTRPAYLLFDISNPEAPPQLLAELSDALFGYTVSAPTLLNSGVNSYLVFGSGPDDAGSASSSRSARLYLYDLRARQFVSGYAPRDLGVAAAFVGNPVSVDWDLDGRGDAVYFGVASGNASTASGALMKLDLGGSSDPARWTVSTVLSGSGPLLGTPAVSIDARGRRWIYAGSGRGLAAADAYSTAQQSLYAVIDRKLSLSAGALYNSSGAQVSGDATLSGISGVRSYTELLNAVDARSGWRLDWPQRGGSAERVLSDPLLLAQTLVVTTYTPGGTCLSGLNRLYQIDAASGALRGPRTADAYSSSATPPAQPGPPLQARLHITPLSKVAAATQYLQRRVQIISASSANPTPLSTSSTASTALDDGEIDWWELHP